MSAGHLQQLSLVWARLNVDTEEIKDWRHFRLDVSPSFFFASSRYVTWP